MWDLLLCQEETFVLCHSNFYCLMLTLHPNQRYLRVLYMWSDNTIEFGEKKERKFRSSEHFVDCNLLHVALQFVGVTLILSGVSLMTHLHYPKLSPQHVELCKASTIFESWFVVSILPISFSPTLLPRNASIAGHYIEHFGGWERGELLVWSLNFECPIML
jgi:hypothetical protein